MPWWLYMLVAILAVSTAYSVVRFRRSRRLERLRAALADVEAAVEAGRSTAALQRSLEVFPQPARSAFRREEAAAVASLLDVVQRALSQLGADAGYLIAPAIDSLRRDGEVDERRLDAIRILIRSLEDNGELTDDLRHLLNQQLLQPARLPDDAREDEQSSDAETKLSDDEQRTIDRLGRLLFEAQYDEAIEVANSDIESAEGAFLAALHNRRGSAYLLRNEVGRARDDFERAVDIAPDHPDYRQNLEQLASSVPEDG